MKLLFDFFPILLFFITFKQYEDPKEGILAATAVIIIATIVQVGISWYRHRKVEKLHLITLILVVIFGGITLILENEIFIKWKPTVVNWLFAAVFFGSEFIGKKSLIRRLMEKNIDLPAMIWTRLNFSWVAFFAVMGVAQPLCGVQLRHRHLGGLQAVWLAWPHPGVCGCSGVLSNATYQTG